MLRALDESPEFEDVFLRTAGESERGEEFTCTTRYLPGVAPRPAAAEPAPEAAPSSPEESADVPSAGDAGGDS
jgi:hypothetical protein